MNVDLIMLFAPFLSGAFGVGVTYGVMRSEIRHLKENLANAIRELDRRVARNETKLETRGVASADLQRHCDIMHRGWETSLLDIKQDIKINEQVLNNILMKLKEDGR
jgi:hypothetical protein